MWRGSPTCADLGRVIHRFHRFGRLDTGWREGGRSLHLTLEPAMNLSAPLRERDPRTFAIIGAAMEVHRHLGDGFLEAVYQEALALELGIRGIPFDAQVRLPIHYKGARLEAVYRADFLCYGSIIVEIKALSQFGGTEQAQVNHYLRATNQEIGLLINFGAPSLQFERFINTPTTA